MSNNSGFIAWFISQHGNRPSAMDSASLKLRFMHMEKDAHDAKALYLKCEMYDAQQKSALYAWCAAKDKK
jgi:hypothetical protein